MRAEGAAILLHAILSLTWIRRSAKAIFVHSLTWSSQDFLSLPLVRPPSTVHCMMVLQRLPWRLICPKYTILRILIVTGECRDAPERGLGLYGEEEKDNDDDDNVDDDNVVVDDDDDDDDEVNDYKEIRKGQLRRGVDRYGKRQRWRKGEGGLAR
ncbi:hypothetical protein ElyMa_004238100 [Elysia marginata]|uniref:Secreted protein n=1 Tax=Elysia marginata TaxID=1093978 RepID=A0AAV4GQB4_9GAST|nr:hypothetical protein ElyMa_004238100 [Elysia marginata]